jgi:anti-sigma B factor antagonist
MKIAQFELGRVTRLNLQGRIVLGDGDDLLKDRVSALLSQERTRLLLNLEEITYMDTSGLAALVYVKITAERRGGDVKLLHLPARIHNLLVITKLTTTFDVFESEADALRSFCEGNEPAAAPADIEG